MSAPLNVVILAAGSGTRMKSGRHKVLHELVGKPMILHVLAAARELSPERVVVVVGHQADAVRAALSGQDVEFVLQEQQLGTAHAYLQAAPLLESSSARTLVLSGDGALLTGATLRRMQQAMPPSGMALLTARVPDPTGLGRVIKDAAGNLLRVVEQKDATEAERAVDEIVVGTYMFDRQGFELARGLSSDNAAGEYYITDLLAAYLAAGMPAVTSETPLEEYAGVNDRSQLAEAERVLLDRIRLGWMKNGVTMQIPESVYIEAGVVLQPDTTLEPGVVLRGNTRVGRGARIGAHSVLQDASVAEGASVAPLSKL